jgi:putative membrane protein
MAGERDTNETADKAPTSERPPGDLVRDHLANKRTMLAWARTGIAVMALGFVVARFGLLLRELQVTVPRHLPEGVSTVFGTALVVIGGILVLLAGVDYLRTGQAIDQHVYRWSPALEFTLSLLLVLAAIVLAVYLVLTS